MLRTILFFLWLLADLMMELPRRLRVLWLGKRGRWEARRRLIERTVLGWANGAMRRGGVRLTVQGRENLPPAGQNVIFVPNHQSFLDIPIVIAGLDKSFPLMAKHVMKRLPFIRGWMKTLECIIVKPGDVATQAAAMRKSRELLQMGESLVIFPEGRRSTCREMLPFQPAAFSLAAREGIPIVPVAIDGCHKNFDCNRWRIRKVDVRLTVLPMIKTEGMGPRARRALPVQVAQTIQAALDAPTQRCAEKAAPRGRAV